MTLGRLTRSALPTAAVLAALFAAGCGQSEPRSATPVVKGDPTRMSPKDLQAFAAMNGVLAGAKAGAKAEKDAAAQAIPQPPVPQQPPTPPAPHGGKYTEVVRPGGVTVTFESGPTARATEPVSARTATTRRPMIVLSSVRSDKMHPTKEGALEDALSVAQVELMKELQKLDPPVLAKPSKATIRSEYLVKDGVHEVYPSEEIKAEFKAKGLESNRLWVKIDVSVSEEQVQRLRAGDRVSTSFQYGGVLFAALLAVYGFLRLDAWTKGYLTSWLAVGAIGLVGVALLVALS